MPGSTPADSKMAIWSIARPGAAILNAARRSETSGRRGHTAIHRRQSYAATRKAINISWGASPRACVALLLCSKALAAVRGRGFVTPDDVKDIAKPVLRHRIVLRSEAEIEGATADETLDEVIAGIEVPR